MAFKKIPLTIDTMIRNPVPVEGINQEDNIELNIVVTENKTPKDLSSQIIKVYIRRIDGTLVEQTNQITPTNARKGEVTVKLKNSAFNKEGYALFQLDISDSSGRITSSYATFKIGKGLVSGEAIANTNEIEALKKVEEYIKKANQELETFKQTVAEINENEATRRENEVVRVRKEASRNEAEAIRTQQEATRKEKENERVQAETKRIADEEVRRENEVLRGSKELERKQAEELRKEKEFSRIADENNRKVAESKRIEAESVRVEAEKLRVTAETERVEAENLRVISEEGRVAAETKREEGFNAFEGRISANTEELKNARSATTGEKFNSLDERIDHEVDRLNKKIDITMLQQQDKESHTIENSVNGMTTDMVIKGRTLNNLYKPNNTRDDVGNYILVDTLVENEPKDRVVYIVNNTNRILLLNVYKIDGGWDSNPIIRQNSISKLDLTGKRLTGFLGMYDRGWTNSEADKEILRNTCIVLDREETYIPQKYFEGIKSFGQQEDKISILSHGKNLFDYNKLTSGEIVSFNDRKCYKFTDNSTNFTLDVKGEENKQYTISIKMYREPSQIEKRLNVQFVYSDGTFKTYNLDHNVLREFTTESGKTLVKIKGAYNHSLNAYIDLECTQLEEGTIKTTYEPYKQDKKDILLQNLGFDEGLRGVNSIRDELNFIRNVAIKKIHKYTLTAELNWYIYDLTEDIRQFYIQPLEPLIVDDRDAINCISSTLPSCKYNDRTNLVNHIYCNANLLAILKPKSTTLEEFKQWLRDNPTTVYYKLAEPVETPFTENINMKTFGERTYIGFENSISGTSSFQAPVNAAATISRLNRENRALEEENKTLRQDFESTTLSLTDSDLELVKQNVDIDFRLMEVEFALDIPQSTLSSNINFKKKGEVKSMARTPYAMMKIVILSGDYDREDYIHKVGKYYERGRMTKEEYDELMSLMTADEVIGG